MTALDQITQLERQAADLERLEHELHRLDASVPLSASRAARVAADFRAKAEQLRSAP